MIPPWLVDGRTLKALSRAIVVAATICAICVALCLGKAYWATSQINDAKARQSRVTKELPDIEAAIKRANSMQRPKTPDPKQACTAFQTAAQGAADQSGATIRDFNTSPEVQVYLSKYTNDSPPEGWKQVSANFSISGTAQSVFDTLEQLRKIDIPFEIDSLEITRSQTDSSGTSIVRAEVQTRVLMRA